jgi:hypothetical protein
MRTSSDEPLRTGWPARPVRITTASRVLMSLTGGSWARQGPDSRPGPEAVDGAAPRVFSARLGAAISFQRPASCCGLGSRMGTTV